MRITVATRHRHLAVAHLPQGPRILPRHPDRGLTLLGKAGIVEDQHPLADGGLGDHLLDPLAVEILLIPLHVGEKLLQALLAGARDRFGHRVAILVGQCCQQPCQVALQGFLALRATETHLEGGQKLLQFRQHSRTGMDIHGSILLFYSRIPHLSQN